MCQSSTPTSFSQKGFEELARTKQQWGSPVFPAEAATSLLECSVRKFVMKENKSHLPQKPHEEWWKWCFWNRCCLAQTCCPFPSLIRITQPHPQARPGTLPPAKSDPTNLEPKLGLSQIFPRHLESGLRGPQVILNEDYKPAAVRWPHLAKCSPKQKCMSAETERMEHRESETTFHAKRDR